MRRKSSQAMGLIALLALCLGVSANLIANRYTTAVHDYTAWPGRPQLELMPPNSAEYSELHVRGADAKEVRTEVKYRNHDFGDRTYVASTHKLIQEHVFYADGTPKSNAVYGKDGTQILSGEARRDDHSLIWKAETDTAGMVTTTMYWYDGSLFGVQKRKANDSHIEATYYRRNGNIWTHQVGIYGSLSSLTLDELYDKDGHRVYVRTSNPPTTGTSDTVGTDTFYRPDGTVWYVQNYSIYTFNSHEPGDYGYSSYKSLTSVDEFAADGKTVHRHIEMMGGGSYPQAITVNNADGSRVEYKVSYDGTVSHINAFNKNGRQVKNEDVKSGTMKIALPKELTASEPTGVDAVKIWQERETNPSSRQVVTP